MPFDSLLVRFNITGPPNMAGQLMNFFGQTLPQQIQQGQLRDELSKIPLTNPDGSINPQAFTLLAQAMARGGDPAGRWQYADNSATATGFRKSAG